MNTGSKSYVSPGKVNEDTNILQDYSKYFKLTPYQRQCLPATNFWRVREGKQPIAIPPNEKLPLICGPETKQDEILTSSVALHQQSYIDFYEVEKPVLRHKKYPFSIVEFLEMEDQW